MAETTAENTLPQKITRREFFGVTAKKVAIGLGGLGVFSLAIRALNEFANRPTQAQQEAKEILDKTPLILFVVQDNEDTRSNNGVVNVRNQPKAPLEPDGSLIGKLKIGQKFEGIYYPGIDPRNPDDPKPRERTWVAFQFERRGGVGFVASQNLKEIEQKK